MKSENGALQSTIVKSEEEISDLQNEITTLNNELMESRNLIQAEKLELEKERKNIKHQQENNSENSSESSGKENYKLQIQLLESQISDLRLRLDRQSLFSIEKDQMIEDLTRDNKTLKLQIHSQQACIKEYQQIIDEMPSFSHHDDLKTLLNDYQSIQVI